MSREMAKALPDDMDIDELRYRLSELFFSKFKNNYSMLEACCDIKRNTFQKVLKAKNGRNVTYILLAKFCVGAGLSVSEAKELFSLMGHELSDTSRRDVILCKAFRELEHQYPDYVSLDKFLDNTFLKYDVRFEK